MYSVFECTHRPPLTPKHMKMLPNTLQGAPRVLWRGLGAYSGVKGSWGVWVRTQTKPSFFHVHVRTPYDPKTPSNNTSSFQYTIHACYNVSRCLVGRLCINGGLWTGRNRSYVSKVGLCDQVKKTNFSPKLFFLELLTPLSSANRSGSPSNPYIAGV